MPKSQLQLAELEESFVLQQLLALKTNKAVGLDKISARLLKNSAHTIALSVTKLLNLSIKTGKFPILWKCSKIRALFKSGERTNASNYQPISILPTLSKILEKAVHTQLYQFLVANKLLSGKQFGFRKAVHHICSDILYRQSPSQYGTETMWSRVFGPNKIF